MIVIEIFKLFGSIFVDSNEANNSIADTEARAEGLAGKLGKGISTAAKWGAGIAAGAGVAVGGMAALIGKTMETTSYISKFSQVTGMSTKGFQEWDSVAKNFGFSMEAAAGDMAALAEKAMDAQSGVGENAEIFKELGVSVEDASGKLKTQEQLFNEVIGGLQGMEDVTRRNAIATMFLSTTGEELAPVLNMTAEELANMKSQANVIDDDQIDKAEKFRLGWENVKSTFGGIVTQIGINLMPLFQGLLNFVNAHMPTIQLVINTVFTALSTGIQIGIKWVQNFIGAIKQWYSDNEETFQAIWETIQSVLNTVVRFIQEKLQAVQKFWKENGSQIKQAVDNLFNGIKSVIEIVMPTVQKIIETAWKTISIIIDSAIKIIMGVIKTFSGLLTGDFSKMWEGIKQIFSGALDAVWGILQQGFLGKVILVIKGFGDKAVDTFNDLTTKAKGKFDDLVSSAKSKFDSVKDAIMTPINNARDGVKNAIDKIKGFFGGLKLQLPKIKLPSFKLENWSANPLDWLKNMPKIAIKWNAQGAIFKKPTIAGISNGVFQGFGEAGAEAAIPLNQNTWDSMGRSIVKAMGSQNTMPQYIVIQNVMDKKTLGESVVDIISGKQYQNTNMASFMKGV